MALRRLYAQPCIGAMLLCAVRRLTLGRGSCRAVQDRSRTANLHSWTTEFDGQPSRDSRYRQQSSVMAAHPVTFERKVDPNK